VAAVGIPFGRKAFHITLQEPIHRGCSLLFAKVPCMTLKSQKIPIQAKQEPWKHRIVCTIADRSSRFGTRQGPRSCGSRRLASDHRFIFRALNCGWPRFGSHLMPVPFWTDGRFLVA
jgi:hypothetical protein